jgi:hypothetical protein
MNTVVYRAKEGPCINYNDQSKYYSLIIPAKYWWWGDAQDDFPVIVNRSKDKSYIKKKLEKILTQT